MNSHMIHETVIRDIIDVISDVKDSDNIAGLFGRKRSFRSVASATSNLTLVFPVICSNNISIENASMIAKATERKAVSLLQILFSAMSVDAVEDGIDYVKKFHTNLKMDSDISVDAFVDLVDTYVAKNESAVVNRGMYDAVIRDLRNINNVLPESISENSIADYSILPNFISNGELRVVKEAKSKGGTHNTKNVYTDRSVRDNTFNSDNRSVNIDRSVRDNAFNSDNRSVNIGRVDYHAAGPANTTQTKYNYTYSDDSQRAKNMADARDKANNLLRNQLISSDVKKANELVPTMMIVNFVNMYEDNPVAQSMVIGVKAKLYPVDSVDVLNRIVIKNKDKNKLFGLVRATTREISFCRDFLFAIDKAKIDALSQSKRGSSSKLWKILERRSLKSKVRRSLGQVNDASAISTLVISQEEVEYLKKTENIDLEKPNVMRPIMESYNLMGVCIVDEAAETAKFMYDTGDDIYEVLSFNHLERENNNGLDRKVVNLMTKMAR